MGLFDRKKLSTSSQTLSLVEDTPEVIKQAIVNSVVTQSPSVSTDIVNSMMSCLGAKGWQYYKYGRDHFTNGLPEGDIGYYNVDLKLVQDVLRTVFPQPDNRELVVTAASLDKLEVEFLVIEWLRKNTNWNYKTNEVYWPEHDVTGYYTGYTVSGTKLDVYLGATANTPLEDSVLAFTFYDADAVYTSKTFYMVEYIITDPDKPVAVGNPWYWSYRSDAGTYPELDLPPDARFTQYLSVVPLRINNVSLTSEDKHNTPLYKTSKKILKKLDLSIEQLDEGINGNPDIKDVDHAYFVMSIPIRTKKQESDKYLFEFFNDMANRSTVTKSDFDIWNSGNKSSTPPINVLTVRDGTYNTKLAYYYISRSTKTGVAHKKIGGVAKYIVGYEPRLLGGTGDRNSFGYENPGNYVRLRKQINENQYTEVIVSGLIHSNNIYTTSVDYITTLEDTEKDSLLIPINASIVNNMNLVDRNTLYYDAMRIVFNAYEWTKLKWYQTGFFKFVTIVVAIAISVISWGTLSGPAAALVTAVGAGVTALTTFVATVLMKLALTAVFQLVVEAIGLEASLIVAAIAFVYGISGSESLLSLPYATTISAIGSGIVEGIQDAVSEVMEEMQVDFQELEADYKEEIERINEINETMTSENLLDTSSLFRNVGMSPTESFADFFTRKLYLDGNEASIRTVDSFYDNKLLLDLGI